jgi:teichoic acid transport system ATP-binding protein
VTLPGAIHLPAVETPPAPLVEAAGLGVRYVLGGRQDDVQSLAFRALLRGKKPEELWALKDVTFEATAGDVVGIIGANGAGKTTLCRVLAGLIRPDAGRLAIRGTTSALLSLGTGFDAELSGRENVFLNGLMLGLSKGVIEERLPEIVEFSGLARFIDQPLKHYSSGMRARLGFSIAAMVEADILVLDEALSAGDREFTERAGEKLEALLARARLVVIVTHQLGFAERYCTKALWLDRGAVRAHGKPRDVVSLYRASLPVRPRLDAHLPRQRHRPPGGSRSVLCVDRVSIEFPLNEPFNGTAPMGHRAPSGRAAMRALHDVSFVLQEGEVLGVIGHNGAGKTTLCRVLTGILRPDTGRVSVAGEVTALLTLGAGFNGQLTGHDNIFVNGMMLGMQKRRIRQVLGRIVEFSGLGSFIDQPVKHYSQGMRSRLGFSIAVELEPDVLIVDEALNAGDAAFHQKVVGRIRELIREARAVILVSHDLAFVEAVCTRVLWLREGCVAFDGLSGEAVARYSGRPPATAAGTARRPAAAATTCESK